MLAAGLLMGAGGAVAVADPGSSGSAAHGDDGTNAPGQQHSAGAKKPKDEPVGTDTNDGSLGSGGQSGQQHSAGAKKPKDEPVGTDTNGSDGRLGSVRGSIRSPRFRTRSRRLLRRWRGYDRAGDEVEVVGPVSMPARGCGI